MPEPEIIRPGHVPADAYTRFVQDTAESVFFLDPEGRVASWNQGAERLSGYKPNEIIGKHFSVFFPAADIHARKPQYELRVAAKQGRFEDEGWRIRADGTMFWANVILTALLDGDRLLGYAKVTRDLTARRHAEEALRQSEERFRLLTHSVKDYAIFMLDTRGHIISWNEGARQLKGYESDEIIGEHFSRFYEPSDIDRGHPQWELEVALRDGRYEEEGWRVRKDGSRFWANVTITALRDATGRHVGYAKVTRDLTTRKEAEEELRQRAAAYANINRELDAFSHTVAHDLRSPIRAMEHLTSILLEEEGGGLTPDGVETLRSLHATALSMARLVQDLLDFSTAAGRQPARDEVDVTALARQVGDEYARLAQRPVEVRVQEGLVAHADAHLLRVALSNLLSNAFKFTRKVPHPRIEVGVEETEHGRAFFVRDNGIGLEPAHASRLFRPFTRLQNSVEFEGTGIGLATVFRIIDRHGGRVWATGKPEQGATFYFTLPPAGPTDPQEGSA
ncbi:MAG TPA: PAS domain S-box protein [Candidatus Thermoplasmatota archaeon]|nr:PAS domain S-box protein [Candidatus Thermoplasmatota archaeon]